MRLLALSAALLAVSCATPTTYPPVGEFAGDTLLAVESTQTRVKKKAASYCTRQNKIVSPIDLSQLEEEGRTRLELVFECVAPDTVASDESDS